MVVVIKLFAQVRALAGTAEVRLDLAGDACARDIAPALAAQLPAVASLLPAARVAINRAFASPDAPVRPGDEVAIIPPVSGG